MKTKYRQPKRSWLVKSSFSFLSKLGYTEGITIDLEGGFKKPSPSVRDSGEVLRQISSGIHNTVDRADHQLVVHVVQLLILFAVDTLQCIMLDYY